MNLKAGMMQRLLWVTLVVTASGCGTAVRFRVPLAEVQRQAMLAPAERGADVRVIPFAPPSMSDGSDAAVEPAIAALGPAGGGYVGPDMIVDLPVPLVPGPSGRAFRPRSEPARVAGTQGWRTAPAVHGTLVAGGHGWRGSAGGGATLAAGRGHAPAIHHGGGGGGTGAAIVGVVAAVVLLAALASADDEDAANQQRARFAETFDGRVTVDRNRTLHVRYKDSSERAIALSQLTPADTGGALYAFFDELDGPVIPLTAPIAAPPTTTFYPGTRPVRPSLLPPLRPPDPSPAPPAPPPTSASDPDLLS